MSRILVTGAGGMLGRDVVDVLSRNSAWETVGTDRRGAASPGTAAMLLGDLTEPGFIERLMDHVRPNVIVHCAAIVDVDRCESDRRSAYELHVEVTERLASYRSGAVTMVYVSTDAIFDGEQGSYSEFDVPRPVNYYALTKLRGEESMLRQSHDPLVIRTNIYGFHVPPGRSLVEWALGCLHKGMPIGGFVDVFFNPLYTRQLAAIISDLLAQRPRVRLVHAASEERLSKHDFLVQVAHTFGFDGTLVQESHAADVPQAAPRPRDTTLDVSAFRTLMGYVPSLAEGLQELKRDYDENTQDRG